MKNGPAKSQASHQDEPEQKVEKESQDKGTEQNFVPVEAFQESQRAMTGALSEITTTLAAIANRPVVVQQQTAQQVTDADITDEELEATLISGEGGAKAIRRAIEAAGRKLVRERVEPLEQFGIQTFGDLTDRVVGKDLKHYAFLKKEVDAQLAQMDPALRASPRAREFAYKMALADNTDKIVALEVEAKLRQSANEESDATSQDKGKGTREGHGKEPSSAMDMFGRESMTALKGVKRDLDSMAKKMGYKGGAEEYLKLAEETYGTEEEE